MYVKLMHNEWFKFYFASFYFLGVSFCLNIFIAFILEYTSNKYSNSK